MFNTLRAVRLVCIAAVFAAVPTSLLAQAATTQKPAPAVKEDVVFPHLDGTSKIYTLDLADRQKFVVAIDKTCTDAFNYSYVGLERGQLPSEAQENQPLKKKPLDKKTIEITYDDRFGGYIFNIVPNGKNAGDICEGGEKLGTASFIVAVRQQTWNLSFSGGFTISNLTNPVYSVKTEGDTKTVVRNEDQEDNRRLGVASFVHVFHDKIQWKQVWPTMAFGLGINNDNRVEYLVGGRNPPWRPCHRQCWVGVGLHLSPAKRRHSR
jgi:hypothetical protein